MDRKHATPAHQGPPPPAPAAEPSDAELIDRVRAGDLDAFDPLYVRHARSALLHARHWVRGEAAAEDLRAEAFTRVLYAIRSGNGPTETFRPYLLATMRHVASDWAQNDRRLQLVPDLVDLAGPDHDDQDPVIAALERALAGQAFSSLPERWQLVLWHTEVEDEGPTQVAPLLGIEPAAAAALAYRAREGLRQAYLQAHISDLGAESCRPFAEKLGAHVRGRLGRRDQAKVRRHLHECEDCASLAAMLGHLNSHIGAAVAPAVLGTAVATKAFAAAVLGTSGVTHAALAVRILAKARYASPRQQAVALGTTAAVATAVAAFALTGSDHPTPSAAPKPVTSRPVLQPTSPTPPTPASPPPTLTPPTQPHLATTIAPTPPPIATSSPTPPARPPTTASLPTTPPTTPTPTPQPSHVMCPGVAKDWLPASGPSWIGDILVDPQDEVNDPLCAPIDPPAELQ
ncbi:MAG TPA: sigma-70 family RNA polymerase sigma factor [Actinocrinis sp.]|nr:sigma-70 family RNA polymerase sigma factor [Actinocrinis sp.]